jgi:hypothetical protein
MVTQCEGDHWAFHGCLAQPKNRTTINSGTKRRHKGALPLVGESEVTRASEVKC